MAAKKTSQKNRAKKTTAKRAPTSAKKTAKKTGGRKSLAKKATSAASKVTRKTKEVAKGAQKVGRIMGVIGNLVEASGKAAEDLTTEVERRKR